MILMNYFATLNTGCIHQCPSGQYSPGPDMGYHGTRCLYHFQTAGLRRSDG